MPCYTRFPRNERKAAEDRLVSDNYFPTERIPTVFIALQEKLPRKIKGISLERFEIYCAALFFFFVRLHSS